MTATLRSRKYTTSACHNSVRFIQQYESDWVYQTGISQCPRLECTAQLENMFEVTMYFANDELQGHSVRLGDLFRWKWST